MGTDGEALRAPSDRILAKTSDTIPQHQHIQVALAGQRELISPLCQLCIQSMCSIGYSGLTGISASGVLDRLWICRISKLEDTNLYREIETDYPL